MCLGISTQPAGKAGSFLSIMACEGTMRGEALQSIRNYLSEALCPSSTENSYR